MIAAKERYFDLIDATLRHALANRPPPPTDGPLTMEHAMPAIAATMNLSCEIRRHAGAQPEHLLFKHDLDKAVDGSGQCRPIYLPLVIRPYTRTAFGWEDHVGGYFVRAWRRAQRFAAETETLQASDGAEIAATLLDALIAYHAHHWWPKGARLDVASAFSRVIRGQQADGLFLARTSADQLEPAWYHELAVLHAVTMYARLTGDAAATDASIRSARYHAEQVQPDHASSHPFALAALLDDPEGIHLADMMLHAAGVQQPATMDAVSLVLLFDALDCEGRAKPA